MITLSELTLTNEAYLDNDMYSAHATDKNKNEYMVHWEIIADDFENLTDESNACDWENPVYITAL